MLKQIHLKISIMLVALTLILSIFAMLLLNGSVAWFAENDRVTAGGFNVRVNSGMSITASLKSYPITDIDYSGGIYTASFDAESYTLPTEDPNGISYSEYKKALAIMITLTAADERTVKIKFTSPSGIETIDDVENKISNCISISTARISEVDGKPTFTKIADTEASFVTINNGVASKVNEIELTLDNPNVSVGKNDFYFILEYKYSKENKYELISYIGELVMSNQANIPLLEANENQIHYHHDVEFEVYEQ